MIFVRGKCSLKIVNQYCLIGLAVFSLVFRVTGKSAFWTGKAALLKIFFYPGMELSP